MDKSIASRLKRLENSQTVKLGDFVICTMNDGEEKQLYWVEALQAILDEEVTAIKPYQLQNGEGLALCEIFLMSEDNDEES